jgi:hypothetical protein
MSRTGRPVIVMGFVPEDEIRLLCLSVKRPGTGTISGRLQRDSSLKGARHRLPPKNTR